MSAITTHVLDTALGLPAAGVSVRLDVATDTGWQTIGAAVTDTDGRAGELGPATIGAGGHRLTFDTATYFARDGRESFFPEVTIVFTVTDPTRHHHVPVLLSPFAYSTYRGS